MTTDIIYIDENSEIPLSGIDFIGIIDRGTNVIELKPLTLCNLKCKYCFVRAGDYKTNFIVDLDYLLKKLKELIEIKGKNNIEIHLAPYGEMLLYPQLFEMIEKLWKIEGIDIISMQTNGLLLNEEVINKLEAVNLSRINISLNSLNQEKNNFLSNCINYNTENLVKNILFLLDLKIDVLIAPVWFPGENDNDIEEIIKFICDFRSKGYSNKKIQLGIQKYLIYKTGRKLKKIRPKNWSYFYKQLSNLETKYNIKLKLGPIDFGIHKRTKAASLNFKKNDLLKLKVVSKGRWEREFIGKINERFAIKVLINNADLQSENLIGKNIPVKIIKANYKYNIFTASLSI